MGEVVSLEERRARPRYHPAIRRAQRIRMRRESKQAPLSRLPRFVPFAETRENAALPSGFAGATFGLKLRAGLVRELRERSQRPDAS